MLGGLLFTSGALVRGASSVIHLIRFWTGADFKWASEAAWEAYLWLF